jgi:RimJ/RimL family protein N-acetyltransferase
MQINTERLQLAPLSAADWPLFYQLHTDPAVIAYCFDVPSRAEIEAKFAERLLPWTPGAAHWLCLVITERSSGQPIGLTGFCQRQQQAEVGFMLLPSVVGRGYATESLQALLQYAKRQLGLRQFSAVVTAGNVASEQVLRKCGFLLEQIVPAAYQIGGKLYADHYFVLT